MRWSMENDEKPFPQDEDNVPYAVRRPWRNAALVSSITGLMPDVRIAILGGRTKPSGTANGKACFLPSIARFPTQRRMARFTAPMSSPNLES